jgi:hypothetical protein
VWLSPLASSSPGPVPSKVELAAVADSLKDDAAFSDKSLSALLVVELGMNEI